MTKRLGFFKERYRQQFPAIPFPGHTISIIPSLSQNNTVVTFNVTSTLPSQNYNFTLVNSVNDDFTDGANTGVINLNVNGAGNISRTINTEINFDYVTNNTNVFFKLSSIHGKDLASSSNVTFTRGNTFSAIGGTETQISNTTLKLHSYTSAGTSGFNITSLGPDPANATVSHLIIGGGGRGGDGYNWWSNVDIGITPDPVYSRNNIFMSGGGGAGATLTEGNALANSYSIANLSVVVGAGSNTMGQSGNSSTFNSIVSVGGGSGSGVVVDPANANSAVYYDATAVINGPGGGGTWKPANAFIRDGANGTMSGGNSMIVVDRQHTTGTQSVWGVPFGTTWPGRPELSPYGPTGNITPIIGAEELFWYKSVANANVRIGGAGSSITSQPEEIYSYINRIFQFNQNADYYSPANGSIGYSTNITGSNVDYAGGGGGGPVPIFDFGNGTTGNPNNGGRSFQIVPRQFGIPAGSYNPVISIKGLGQSGGGNSGTVGNVGVSTADLHGQPGQDGKGSGGGAGGAYMVSNTKSYLVSGSGWFGQPAYGSSYQGGKGGDGGIYITYPFYIRQMQV